jgi:hypothetical protein
LQASAAETEGRVARFELNDGRHTMHLSECQASDMEGFHEAKEDSTGEVRWEEREEFKVEKKDGDRMGCATAPVRKEEPREVEIATRVASTTCATTTAVQLSSMGTTSFTDYYTEAVRLAPADYLGRWLDYGRLRRMLARGKELREQHAATPFCDCELLPEDCVCVRPRGDQPGEPPISRPTWHEARTEPCSVNARNTSGVLRDAPAPGCFERSLPRP